MKYLGFYWTIDTNEWLINDCLADAKKEFGFGMIIFEVKNNKIEDAISHIKEVKSNRLSIAKLKEWGCPIVYQEGEPLEWHVTK